MLLREVGYARPGSLGEAIELLRSDDGARALAGGQTLINVMKARAGSPDGLVDLSRIEELKGIELGGDGILEIGAMATYTEIVESGEARARPILGAVCAQIADVQVRNRGTIGGSLVHADPASDLPATALALGAELRVAGPRGQRSIKAEDFFVGLLTTAIAPDEILTEVRFPLLPAKTGAAYVKVRNKASHYAIVGVAAVVTLGGDGRCQQARIGLTGVTHKPQRASAAESALAGQALDDGVIAEAAGLAADGIKALSDIHASAEFRLHLAKVMTGRALKLALSRS